MIGPGKNRVIRICRPGWPGGKADGLECMLMLLKSCPDKTVSISIRPDINYTVNHLFRALLLHWSKSSLHASFLISLNLLKPQLMCIAVMCWDICSAMLMSDYSSKDLAIFWPSLLRWLQYCSCCKSSMYCNCAVSALSAVEGNTLWRESWKIALHLSAS